MNEVSDTSEHSEDPIVDVTAMAHGGHAIARLDGQVVFVRHALPGERVRIRVTERTTRFLRADATEVITAAPDRVPAPCPVAGVCGGCDFQHVSMDGQRRLLGSVVREQLQRIAGIDWPVDVEDVGSPLGWRTRMTWSPGPQGKLGLRRHRSHEVVDVGTCLIAHPELPLLDRQQWDDQVTAVVSSAGERVIATDAEVSEDTRAAVHGVVTSRGLPVSGLDRVTEAVHDHRFTIGATGFWQVHPRAAETLVDAVLAGAMVREGDTVFDLYSGAGLFSAFLADHVGDGGAVHAVEGSRTGAEDAQRRFTNQTTVHTHRSAVDRALTSDRLPARADVIVLDPPRAGAKKEVPLITARSPRRIVHVACDPAALARDVSLYAKDGYELVNLRAFALFPMTHHVECVAVLAPNSSKTA